MYQLEQAAIAEAQWGSAQLAAEQLRRARLTVCAHAIDAADARHLLAMLGLIS